MKKIHAIIMTIALGVLPFLSAALIVTTPVFAAKCGGAETSVIECTGEGEEALFDIIKQVIRILTGAIFVIAIGAVVFGAVLYTSSGDSPEGIKKARTIWVNTVIGMIMYAFMVAITNFLIPGGVFD